MTVALPLICMKHRNAWKGWTWKAHQPFPEDQDLLHRDAAAAQANLSASSGKSHLEVERLSNGALFKSLTITRFLLFCLCHVKHFPLLNCPLIAAESIRLVLQAGGGGRSQEPASLEKQMISTSSWLTLSSTSLDPTIWGHWCSCWQYNRKCRTFCATFPIVRPEKWPENQGWFVFLFCGWEGWPV